MSVEHVLEQLYPKVVICKGGLRDRMFKHVYFGEAAQKK